MRQRAGNHSLQPTKGETLGGVQDADPSNDESLSHSAGRWCETCAAEDPGSTAGNLAQDSEDRAQGARERNRQWPSAATPPHTAHLVFSG